METCSIGEAHQAGCKEEALHARASHSTKRQKSKQWICHTTNKNKKTKCFFHSSLSFCYLSVLHFLVTLQAEAFSFPGRQAPRVRRTSLAAKGRSCLCELQILLQVRSGKSNSHTTNKNEKTRCFNYPSVILLLSWCYSALFSGMATLRAEAFAFLGRRAPRGRHTSLAARRRSCMCNLQILLQDRSEKSNCHTTNKNKKTWCFNYPSVIFLLSSCYSVLLSVLVTLQAETFSYPRGRAPRVRHTSLAAKRRSYLCELQILLQDRNKKSICHPNKDKKAWCFNYPSDILLLSSCDSVLLSVLLTLQAEALAFPGRRAPSVWHTSLAAKRSCFCELQILL